MSRIATTLALSGLLAVAASSTAPAADGLDRRDVETAYLAQLDREQRPFTWSGDVGACVAGEPSSAVQSDSLASLNFFRWLAGLAPVQLDDAASASAQQAALMMAANGQLSHTPTRFWRCASQQGIDAAGRSNLFMGATASQAINGYMADDGVNNQQVGHRTWLLHPGLRTVGIGNTPETNAVAVFGEGAAYDPAPPNVPVAWPAPGPFPTGLAPSRWSLTTTAQLTNEPRGWEGSSVTVTKGSRTWNPPIINRTRALVWYMDDTASGTYMVRVTGTQDFSYSVELFEPTVRMGTAPQLTGRALVGRSLKVQGGTWRPTSARISVRWKVGKRVLPRPGKRLAVKAWMRGKTVRANVTGSYEGLVPRVLTLRKAVKG